MEIVTPGFVEWSVLKLRAWKFARELKAKLALPETDPVEIESDISWKVAVNDAKYDLTYDQREELLKLIMDDSGMTAIKEQQQRLLDRKVG